MPNPAPWTQVRTDVLAEDRFSVVLFASFAVVALLLAGVGIYGVMAFSVTQRSHEIALRMALGANRGRVVGMIVREGILLAGIGLTLGLISSYFIGRAMRSMLFGVRRHGLLRLRDRRSRPAGSGPAGLLSCPLGAQPRCDPMQVLRTE